MVSLFFFLLHISVININLVNHLQPPHSVKKQVATLATLATLATNDRGLQPAEMLKTEMHKTAKVCQKALFSKRRHFNI